VYRPFGTRAGIFAALLDDDERAFQQQVLSGPPPLGPGAPPPDRLIAYGRARIDFLIRHREIARAALDGREQVPAGSQTPMSRAHIRFLLGQMRLAPPTWTSWPPSSPRPWTDRCCSTCHPPS
jgi:polyketide synthase 12